MIDIQEHLSKIIIALLIVIIIYLAYKYYFSKQKIFLLEKKITELNKIKYLDNTIDTKKQNKKIDINPYSNTDINPDINPYSNTDIKQYTIINENVNDNEENNEANLYCNQQTCNLKNINYPIQYDNKKQNNKIDINSSKNKDFDSDNDNGKGNYKLLNNNTIENYGMLPIDLNLLLHTAIQTKIDNNIKSYNSDSDSDSDSETDINTKKSIISIDNSSEEKSSIGI